MRLDVGGDTFELALPFVFRILEGCHPVKTYCADDVAINISKGVYMCNVAKIRGRVIYFTNNSRFPIDGDVVVMIP